MSQQHHVYLHDKQNTNKLNNVFDIYAKLMFDHLCFIQLVIFYSFRHCQKTEIIIVFSADVNSNTRLQSTALHRFFIIIVQGP